MVGSESGVSPITAVSNNEAHKPGVVEKIELLAHNGGGVRDTARVLKISKSTVIKHLKKSRASKSGQ